EIAGAARALRTVAAELVEARIEIGAVAAKPALGDDSGDCRGLLARTEPVGIHDHAGQPRRQRQRAQALALRGDAAISIERAEFVQQASSLFQRRSRWWVEEG